MQVTKTSEAQIQTDTTDKQLESVAPSRKSSRKSILALSVFALAINGTAAIYTLPSFDIPLPNVSSFAELLPHQKAFAPIPDSITLASLRQSITDERGDVKKISAQLSTLIAKVDSLQNAITPEITSSIPKGRARNRLSGVVRKRMARQPKPVGPVSVGGVPLSFPATTPAPEG